MAIESISFRPNFTGKKEKKENSGVQIPENIASQHKTPLDKIRNHAASLYVAGMMAAAAPTMTSCIQQDQDVTVDTSAISEALQQMMTLQKQSLEVQNQILDLLKENNSQNKELLQKLISQNTQILSILSSINVGVGDLNESITAALYKIAALIQTSNENDAELLAKIDTIINGQGTNAEKLEELIALNKENTAFLTNIMSLIEKLKEGNENLSNNINNFFKQYQEGDKSHKELMNQILTAILANNQISAETLAEIKKIAAGNDTDSAKLDAIIKLLESIDSKLDAINASIKGIPDNFVSSDGEKMADILANFMKLYGTNSDKANLLAEKMLQAMIQSNMNDVALYQKAQEILEQLKSGQIGAGTALDAITSILNQINTTTKTILSKLETISSQLSVYMTQQSKKDDEIKDLLVGIKTNTGSIDSKLDKIMTKQDEANTILLNIAQKSDEAVSNLQQINTKTITLEQAKELLGPLFNKIGDKLDIISGNQISVAQLEELLNKNKTDLTKTNALLETINTTIQNKQTGSGLTDAQLNAIIAAVKQVQTAVENGSMTQEQANQKILDKLASMEGMMSALVDTGKEINANFKSAMSSAQTFGTKLFEELEKLQNNGVSKEQFQTFVDKYTQATQEAQQAREEQIAILKSLVGNQGGSLTIEQLKTIIPDYTSLLNEIKAAIGNIVTKSDLDQFSKDHPATDLSKTNALIETLNTTLQNKNFNVTGGSGSVDTSAMTAVLNKILDNLQNQKLPTEDQLKVLIEYVNKILSNSSSSTGGTTAKANTRSAHDSRANYFAALNRLSIEAAKAQNKQPVLYSEAFKYDFEA